MAVGEELVQTPIYTDSRLEVDSTGAGDSFSSGFISALFYGKDLKTATRWGVVNAGCNIKEVGAIHGLLTKNKMEEIVK